MSATVAYLLGELDDAGAAEFEAAMVADPALREEVERLRPIVTKLERVPVEAWEDPEPPPLALPSPVRAARRRLVLRPVMAAACALALLAGGVGLGVLLDRDPPPQEQLALKPVGDLDPDAAGRVSVSANGATVRVSGLHPTAGGDFYQLWLLGKDKQLVGLGSFRVGADGAATFQVPLPVDPDAFQFFDLSLEPGDGDPGHSGVSVLRGPTAA